MAEIDTRNRAPRELISPGGAAEPSLAELTSRLIADAQTLVRKEVELARAELSDELNKAKQAGVALGAGAAIAGVGALLLVIMVVQLLIAWGAAPWLAYLIVGGALTVVGSLALLAGMRRAQTIDPMPHETIDTVREDVEWLKEQSRSARR